MWLTIAKLLLAMLSVAIMVGAAIFWIVWSVIPDEELRGRLRMATAFIFSVGLVMIMLLTLAPAEEAPLYGWAKIEQAGPPEEPRTARTLFERCSVVAVAVPYSPPLGQPVAQMGQTVVRVIRSACYDPAGAL